MQRKTIHDEKLEDREQVFHDEWAEGIDPGSVLVNETFSACTSPEPQWLWGKMGSLRGKRLLDLGCGAGEGAVFFATKGARVVAADLSPKMLDVVQDVAKLHGVTLETQVCSAVDLSIFPSESFDFVYAANLLHHVDIQKCLDEIKRILKPGGAAAFWDPVAHNPAINVYRRLAAGVRTEDEHPIRWNQLKWFKQRFSKVETRFFWFFSTLIFVKFFLLDRIDPSKERYWKRILSNEAELRKWYKPLAFLDSLVLPVLPFFKWWCWNIAIMVWKENFTQTSLVQLS